MSITELYQYLVLELGFRPDYVLDNMKTYEIRPLLQKAYLRHREDWEIGRSICYTIAQSNSSKKLKVKDIMKFLWDDEKKEEHNEIDWNEVEQIKNEMIEMENNFM